MRTRHSDDVEDTKNLPTERFNKWMVLVSSTLTYGMAIGIPVSFSVMFLDWQDTFQVTRARTAVVHSSCVGIVFGGAIIPGYVMSRFGPRFTLLLGSFLATIGLVTSMFATSIDYLVISTGVIAGLGYSFIQLPIMPCLTVVFKTHKTLVISLCQVAAGLVNVVNPYFIRYLINIYGWRGTLAILAGVTFNTCIPGLIISSFENTRQKSDLLIIPKTSDCDEEEEEEEEEENEEVEEEDKIKDDDNDNDNVCACDLKKTEAMAVHNSQTDEKLKLNFSVSADAESNTSEEYQQILIDGTKTNDCQKPPKNNFINNPKLMWIKFKRSKWRFFTDPIYLLFLVHMCFCASAIFAFTLILMDFSSTNGFGQETGVFFIMIVFASSMLSRLGVGLTDLFPQVHSLVIQVVISFPGSIAMLFLSFVSSQGYIICLLCFVGISLGGLVSIAPRCVLDMRSVDRKTYPIALGVMCSWEGIMSFIIPVIIGYSVDVTGSYKMILILIGCASLLCTLTLAVGYLCRYRDTRRDSDSSLNGKVSTYLENPQI